jgi:hypothetical protein
MAKKGYKPLASKAELKAAEDALKAIPNWEKIGQVMYQHNQVGYKAMAYMLQGKTAEELANGEG